MMVAAAVFRRQRRDSGSCALVAAARWLVKLGVMVSVAVLVQVYSSVNGSRF